VKAVSKIILNVVENSTCLLTTSFLKELERSGLISQRRESRSIIYSASYEALADLVKFLMDDCCAGHPAIRENVERADDCCIPVDKGEVVA
jgi:ArsR family transcriptional regulator